MRIGVFIRSALPLSIQSDVDNLTRELAELGADLVPFSEAGKVPGHVDCYWNPGTGRPGPHAALLNVVKPIIVTFHGVANLALPIAECFGHAGRDTVLGLRSRLKTLRAWFRFRERCSDVIAVSDYARIEFARHLPFVRARLRAIHHGVDHSRFWPAESPCDLDRYLLHVSAFQPKKNLNRIIQAYRLLSPRKIRLLVVAPGYEADPGDGNVEIVRRPLRHAELAPLYRNAMGFIFPSLHETFGHPIVEAMASGCPVITSNSTACAEVAGGATLTVDPRSVAEIAGAMQRLISNAELRAPLRERGLKRASAFSWKKRAEQHARVFASALHKPHQG
jgi:glycosyltransferase involved in cell wall biosynthesis